jgi:short-subunit dehydrogenase
MKNWAIITGASSGIGEAFTDRFALSGYNLILISRTKNKLLKIKQEYEFKYGIMIEVIPVDLTDNDSIGIIKPVISDKKIDILVNNAGFGIAGNFIDQEVGDLENMIRLNCIAPILLTKLVINLMIKENKGNIIFLGSLLSFLPTPFNAVYAATKAFDESLAASLWFELKNYNINVISVNPGTTKTNFHKRAGLKRSNTGREPEEIVKTTLKFLGKKPSVIDGLKNKIVYFISRIVTRKFFIKLTGKLFYKMKINNEQ